MVGGGFAGLAVARGLRRADVEIEVVDRSNHHLFQPLLYQVAMAGLSPADIAVPIRGVLGRQANARVLLANVAGVRMDDRVVVLDDGAEHSYDYLVLAAGARTSYFGRSDFERHTLGLKSLEDALAIRHRVLRCFELAERRGPSPGLLTFVVVGGGPTGVELAGSLAELSRFVLARDYRAVEPADVRVVLLEGSERILGGFDPALSVKARQQLEELGVEVRTGTRVDDIDESGVHMGEEGLLSRTVIWAAGVAAESLADGLSVERDRAGRIVVEPDCSIAGRPEVFVIGDMAAFQGDDGRALPGIAPVAIQTGGSRGAVHRLRGRGSPPLRLPRQGHDGHHRPLPGGGPGPGPTLERPARLAGVALRSSALPDRLSQQALGASELELVVPDLREGGPPHHHDRAGGGRGSVLSPRPGETMAPIP